MKKIGLLETFNVRAWSERDLVYRERERNISGVFALAVSDVSTPTKRNIELSVTPLRFAHMLWCVCINSILKYQIIWPFAFLITVFYKFSSGCKMPCVKMYSVYQWITHICEFYFFFTFLLFVCMCFKLIWRLLLISLFWTLLHVIVPGNLDLNMIFNHV